MNDEYRVLLPPWIVAIRRENESQFKQSVISYIAKGRPEYKVISVKGSYAICRRNR